MYGFNLIVFDIHYQTTPFKGGYKKSVHVVLGINENSPTIDGFLIVFM